MERRSSFHPSEDSFDLQLNQEDDYSMPLSALSAMPTPAHGADTAQGRRMDNVVQMQGSLFTEQVKKDSQKVCIQRSIFLAVLVTVGVLGTVFIHESTAQREQSLFETYFESLADQLTDNFLTIFEVKILTSISVSVSLTSDAQYYNKTWPNSLLPDFDLRLKGDRIITGSHTILFSPLVTDETRASWEAFVLENANQLTVQPNDASSCTTAVDSSSSSSACRTLADGIYMPGPNGTLIPDPGPGPYFPGFLLSTSNAPENAQFILTNYYAVPGLQDMYNSLMEEMTPIMSDMKGTAPRSLLSTPVFNQITPPQSVVGAVQLDVDWLTQFQTVSPSEGSIVAVLVTGGGDVMSFEIFDGYVVFLGDGDLHDPQYDNYVVTTKVSAVAIQNMTSGIWQSNNGSNTWDTFGYSLSVYPTSSFEAAFKTNLPAIYTAVSAVIFAFIILMFALYDVLVHRRQQHVMGEAVRFRNVVNSLFPAVVRNRLFAQQEGTSSATTTSTGTTMPKDRTTTTTTTQQTRRIAMRRWDSIARRASNDDLRVAEPATTRLRTFLHRSASQNRVDMEQYRLDDPIADLFPETTIMFADISGFTAWSSEREPSQVFYLLETLYHAFDELASRLGVFKVETIGDCYVAVTGLPDPNQDHALVMARFAYECLLKMNELVKSLEVSLGPGTSDLAIRVGLHSGPVTAGVLRGEKARFQLFGDTMNTASRMESTGTRNRIHVSEETAMLLRRGGKGIGSPNVRVS
ncbi:adenylyl/guanylyl cyclase [Fragilaria crotonensis]|nr:adenylyl/guanylyl cyclase [Fragilaria crotonensis]